MELQEEDIPDSSIWHDAKRLDEWFSMIRQRQQNPGHEPVPQAEEADMTEAELPEEFLVAIGRKSPQN